jgi:hypothetical protein
MHNGCDKKHTYGSHGNLPPLDIFINGEARMGAYRLKCNDSWRNLENGHSRITNVITNPVLEMGSDYVLPKYSSEKQFDIQMDCEHWCHKEEQCLSKGLIRYTDESKANYGSGAAIHGKSQDMISMSYWGNKPRFFRLKYVQQEPVFRRS